MVAAVVVPRSLQAGEVTSSSGYSLLSPIRSGNLTVFPVVASKSYDTSEFLTLDEGLRSGDVVVTEAGQARGLIRRRPGEPPIMHPMGDAEVNRLVLQQDAMAEPESRDLGGRDQDLDHRAEDGLEDGQREPARAWQKVLAVKRGRPARRRGSRNGPETTSRFHTDWGTAR